MRLQWSAILARKGHFMATRILNCLDGVGDLNQLARGGVGIGEMARFDEFHGLAFIDLEEF
jgi:hypothetical protein